MATLPAVECAAGLLAAPAVAAHPLVVRLGLGGVDLIGDLGCDDSPEALAYPRSVLVVASRAAGLPGPVNSVYTRLDDPEGLVRHARAAKALGFAAQSVLSPRQLDPVRDGVRRLRAGGGTGPARCWRPSPPATGPRPAPPRGDFVDLPVAERARRILAVTG